MNRFVKRDLILHVLLPMFFGGLIYLLYRPLNLNLFKAVEFLQLMDFTLILREFIQKLPSPNILIYSLPDGIWMYSLTSLLLIFLKNSKKAKKYLPALCLMFALGSEFAQAFQFFKGTYDIYDILLYIVGFATAYLIVDRKNKEINYDMFNINNRRKRVNTIEKFK